MTMNSKNIGLISGPLAFIFVLLFFRPEGLNPQANAVLASTIWIAIWWITEAIPIAVTALLPIVLFNWVTPNWHEIIWIIGVGLFTQLGQTFLTIGLKNLPASEASTINYLQVLFGSIWGILFFREIININFLLGASLVLLGTIISTTKIIKRT